MLCTGYSHPFYVIQDGEGVWVQAKDLHIGDAVLSADGSTGIVQAVTVIAEPQIMYNLTVELVANYLVGDGRWVVHNVDLPFPDFGEIADWFNRHTNRPSRWMFGAIEVWTGPYEYRSGGKPDGLIYVGEVHDSSTSIRERLGSKPSSFGGHNSYNNVTYSYIDFGNPLNSKEVGRIC